MVEAWLKMKDDVYDEHGEPTWNSLVKGLKKVNQKSLASKIIGNKIEPVICTYSNVYYEIRQED